MYKYIIFDVDDTLLDFYSAFKNARIAVADKLGVAYSKDYMAFDEKCGWQAWKESGLDNTTSKEIQDNYHDYYYQYIRNHNKYLLQALELSFDENELLDCYIKRISSSKILQESSTLQVYAKLSEKYKLALATNGIKKIQRNRISDFMPYTYKTYISEEIGCIKPSKEFFEYMIHDLQCDPSECLMIGDSITNDMAGAKAVGMDACFYNVKNKKKSDTVIVDYEIKSIETLLQLLF